MASGNFLIGKDLSLEVFKQYVQPILEKRGYSVQDKLSVLDPASSCQRIILVSIVGEGDLEKGINDLLIESGKVIEKSDAEIGEQDGNSSNSIAFKYQVSKFSHWVMNKGKKDVRVDKGQYETRGIYQSDDVASQLFPLIAQEYLLEGLEAKAEGVIEQIKSLLGEKLSDLN